MTLRAQFQPSPDRCKVILIDDHTAFRQPFALVLGQETDLEVVGQAGTFDEGLGLLDREANVVVVDLDLPGGSGHGLIRRWQAAHPDARIMVLTSSESRQDEAMAVEAGASAIEHKSTAMSTIIETIRRLGRGEDVMRLSDMIELLRYATRQRACAREAERLTSSLTPREREVVGLLAEGLSDREIAERLLVSPETVRTRMVNILGKLGVKSRLGALVVAVRYGLVVIEPIGIGD
jgi:DNA-binding NarL/FixJ family response regulator